MVTDTVGNYIIHKWLFIACSIYFVYLQIAGVVYRIHAKVRKLVQVAFQGGPNLDTEIGYHMQDWSTKFDR